MNAGRNKPDYNVDLRVYKDFLIGKYNTELFVKIENLLDRTKPENFPQLRQKDLEGHEKYDYLNSLYDISYSPTSQPVRVG